MLELKNIYKSFEHPQAESQLNILQDISLTCKAGETIAITGPSGSGKTTLLNIIGGLDNPTSGQVLHQGENIISLSEKQLAEFRNQHIGFIFQQHHLLPQLTTLENVLLPTLVTPSDQKEKIVYAQELLDKVGLSDRLDHIPAQLSGGEQQRVAVVRALINKPQVLLADEPTGSLDQKTSASIANLLVQLNAELETLLIVVTHSMQLAEKMHKRLKLVNGSLEE